MLNSFPKFTSHDFYESSNDVSPKHTSLAHGSSCACEACLGEAHKAVNRSGSADFSSDGTELQEDYTLQDSIFRWQQPGGKGTPLTLSYSYSNLFDGSIKGGITEAEMKAAVKEAFELWAKYAPLNFVEIEDKGEKSRTNPDAADIRIGHENLGGIGGTLGRANLRYDGELATAVVFDNQDFWDTDRTSTAQDFLAVAVHEIGHVLGLNHEQVQNAIMQPATGDIYAGLGSSFLYDDDINGIRAIFGSGSGSVTPLSTSGSGGTPTPEPPTDVVEINGTDNEDLLVGNNLAQTFYGFDGDDVIKAGGGDDVVIAGRGNDKLNGGRGKDRLFGGLGNDVVIAGRGNDKLNGGLGNDRLFGDRGRDMLFGGYGNDRLNGGSGKDRLIGVSTAHSKPGLNERDVLLGGDDADIFVLGDARTAYYNDGRSKTQGLSDYAFIKDFDSATGDKIQLHGNASDYRLGASPSGTSMGKAIFLTNQAQDELIAIVKDGGSLSLQSSAFEFV